jgi:hypothetical protein
MGSHSFVSRLAAIAWALGLALIAVSCDRGADAPRPPAVPAAADNATIDSLASPAGPGSSGPQISSGSDGTIVLSWVEPIGDEFDHQLKYSRWTGKEWGPSAVAASGPSWFVNASDAPAVQPIAGDVWAAHWRVVGVTEYSYDVMVSVSGDAGATWSEPRLLNDDRTATEHGFVSLFDWGGSVGAVWLDGRDTASETGIDDHGLPLGTGLRLAKIAADGSIVQQSVLDSLVCDCCTTGVAATAGGLALVYRDRTPEEIRDIVVRYERGGVWSEPVQAGADRWEIAGCPVNGPAVAARADNVAVAWFTAPNNVSRVRFAASTDGGASFAPAVDVDTDAPIGQVNVAMTSDRTAFVSWWRPGSDDGSELALRRVGFDGALGSPRVVAKSSWPRPTDVPQLGAAGNLLLLAWADTSDTPMIKTAMLKTGAR